MKTHKEYLNEKEEYSYILYKKHRLFKKVRAVIIDENNKVILLKHIDGGVVIPGGGVEEKETLREAVVREALEETGFKVLPIKILGKNFYTFQMQHNGTKFISKRVEYYYLCKKLEKLSSKHGIEGEFENDIEIAAFDIDMLKHTKLNKKGFEKLKKSLPLEEKRENK